MPGGEQSLPTRAGFVGLAGRPNVGKSTLVNSIVGAKVAIISDRPQTTRRASRGVATDLAAAWQLVLVDLPGVQRPRDVLTERMQRRVEHELEDADAVLFVVNAEQGIGPGDRFIARHLLTAGSAARDLRRQQGRPGRPGGDDQVLAEVGELAVVDEVFPMSAKRGTGVAPLVKRLAELVPEGPLLYPPEERTDQASDVHLAGVDPRAGPAPHARGAPARGRGGGRGGRLARGRPDRGPRPDLGGDRLAEADPDRQGRADGPRDRDRGPQGARARARHEVFLDLHVRVREHWRGDEGLLDRLGID